MVAKPSRFNMSEPEAADVRASPKISNSGPMMPPKRDDRNQPRRVGAPQRRFRILTPSAERTAWPIASPMPAPR